eukprot:g13745.t1
MRQRAAALANELAASVETRVAHFTSALARFMFERLYSGLIFEREQLTALAHLSMRAQQEGRSIVYLPSHKSHIDYLVLQFSLWNLGLGAPAIAAGENLNLAVVGSSFSGEDSELYTTVVAAYLEGLLCRGANVNARSYIENYTALQRQSSVHRANFDPQSSASEKGILLKALAYHVLEEINRGTAPGLTRTGSEKSTSASEVDTPSPANTSNEVHFGSVLSELVQVRNTFIHVEEEVSVDQRNLAMQAFVQSLDKDTGRYDVLLISNSGYQLAKIKGENLRIAVPPPPAQRPEDFHRMSPMPHPAEVPVPMNMGGGMQMPGQPCWYEQHLQPFYATCLSKPSA